MSDSDVDLLPNNMYTFQNESTTVSARGPNINASNLTGVSFRNNIMTSTMNMPRNFERQRYMERSHHRSMYYSQPAAPASPPMSLRSESSFRPRNYQHMYYPHAMSSQRSMVNGRSGSPMSVRSIDSNATVSAADIAMAFKSMNFNKYDLRVIKDAYNQFMKKRMRRKIEKRRNLRLFLKGQRRKSGYDSGELGSDSSISSDDCRSTRTSVYKDNISTCRSTKTNYSTRTNYQDFRRTIKEGDLYKDCTENIRQNTFKNMLGVAPRNATTHSQSTVQNEPLLSQKDRFKSGFLLPSQRFNQSVASVPIQEKQSKIRNLPLNQRHMESGHTGDNSEIESDQEEIFSEITIRENTVNNADTHRTQNIDPRKRCLDIDEVQSHNKKSKLSSPPKKNKTDMLQRVENAGSNKNCNEFQFLKPQFPIKKSGNVKVKETLLAKSTAPLPDIGTDNVPPKPQLAQLPPDDNDENKQNEINEQQSDLTQQSTSDMSMRPSFIKRKLYTQKLDLLESKNLSNDNLANSPQNVYSAIQKEKNKARKLVTNQSCLSRDVREDNNLLDLIHKIVPRDRMNVTSVTNKSEVANNPVKNKSEDDKWDVTSVINMDNNDDVSDTYTDEEIFNNEISNKHLNITENNTKKKNIVEEKKSAENEQKSVYEKKVANEKKKIVNEKKPANELDSTNCHKISANEKKTARRMESTNENTKLKENHQKENEKKAVNGMKTINGKKSTNSNNIDCKIVVEKLPLSKLAKTMSVAEQSNLFRRAKDTNKGNGYSYVKSFWDTDFESDFESGPIQNRVEEKENINHGKSIKKTTNKVNKTLDTTQSQFVWNKQSKPAVTLKSHTFLSQAKAVNINKSFTKRTCENNQGKNSSERKEKIAYKPAEKLTKALSKKIVLDTYNSTVSDNTQNETAMNINKSRTRRAKKNEASTNKKNDAKSHEKIKQTTAKSSSDKFQVDGKNTPRRSPPKKFMCCKEPLHVNKNGKNETELTKNKTGVDNYNSTFGDNTLDEMIKNGNRTRALRATRRKNMENSISDNFEKDDSKMLNMTLRSRQLDNNTSTENTSKKKSQVPKRADVKTRNTSNSSKTKDTQIRQKKKKATPVKGQKINDQNSGKRQSPRINQGKSAAITPVRKRSVKCK
ncbi:uncharacterized protein PF3D7_1120600 [Amyelois transitella]|uniref:uncharacterized protein PF3D7_1120600 n=1 Tax=Amyelois transitella TaxID=680683 RepID=UPI00298FBDD0|nr:uncharacterized protein PF3D7_1120600 [Amyelois transitella]